MSFRRTHPGLSWGHKGTGWPGAWKQGDDSCPVCPQAWGRDLDSLFTCSLLKSVSPRGSPAWVQVTFRWGGFWGTRVPGPQPEILTQEVWLGSSQTMLVIRSPGGKLADAISSVEIVERVPATSSKTQLSVCSSSITWGFHLSKEQIRFAWVCFFRHNAAIFFPLSARLTCWVGVCGWVAGQGGFDGEFGCLLAVWDQRGHCALGAPVSSTPTGEWSSGNCTLWGRAIDQDANCLLATSFSSLWKENVALKYKFGESR